MLKKISIVIIIIIFTIIGALILRFGLLKEEEHNVEEEEYASTETIEDINNMKEELEEEIISTEELTTEDIEITEEITEEEVEGDPPVEYSQNNLESLEDYSRDSNGYWDKLNSEIEDMPSVTGVNGGEIIKGLLMGYISDCEFCTDAFKKCYSTGFLPNVTNVTVKSFNFDVEGSALVDIEMDGEVVSYKVYYLLYDSLIDDIVLEKN